MKSNKVETDHILNGITKFQFHLHAFVTKYKIIPVAIHKSHYIS